MAGKTLPPRRVVVPPSAGLAEFRRRSARARSSSHWAAIGIWSAAIATLLLLAVVASQWTGGAGETTAPLAAAAPEPAAAETRPLPVIRLSQSARGDALARADQPPPANAALLAASPVDQHPFDAPLAVVTPESGAAAPAADSLTELDRIVLRRLEQVRIEPARTCSDAVFLRRVYLDLIGTLPTAAEAEAFLDSERPDKRRELIDELLERPEFADYWAMKWCDVLRVKAEFPINLWPNAAQAYHRWIRTAVRDNLPYDRFARELLTGSGSNFRTPQVNFYRAMQARDPESIAKAAALTFMGERAERWPPERLKGFAPLFAQVGYKPTGEWKEEIVLFDPRKVKRSPELGALTATLPDGTTVELPEGTDPRTIFADWLIRADNPRFVQPIVNRVWNWLIGRGIVEPPDDFRADNRPRQPELLDYLGRELVASGYDLRRLIRLIANSATYQRSCVPANAGATQSAAEFASYPLRRLDAEVLIDAICQITGTTETYSSMVPEPFTFLPDNQRAIALPDGSITSSFLEMFGRPARDTGFDSERNNRLTPAQALHLLNSNHIRQKIERGPRLRELFDNTFNPDLIVEQLYLRILSRRPTDEERSTLMWGSGSEQGLTAIVWALINSEEFLLRH